MVVDGKVFNHPDLRVFSHKSLNDIGERMQCSAGSRKSMNLMKQTVFGFLSDLVKDIKTRSVLNNISKLFDEGESCSSQILC